MRKGFVCLVLCMVTCMALAQNLVDCVNLKNGGRVKGTIVEQVVGVSVKIQTADGSIFVFKVEEISSITKEPSTANYPQSVQGGNQNYGPGQTQPGYVIPGSNVPASKPDVLSWSAKFFTSKPYLQLNDNEISDEEGLALLGDTDFQTWKDAARRWQTVSIIFGASSFVAGVIWAGYINDAVFEHKNYAQFGVATAIVAGIVVGGVLAELPSKRQMKGIINKWNDAQKTSWSFDMSPSIIPFNHHGGLSYAAGVSLAIKF